MNNWNQFDTLHYAVELPVTLTIIQAILPTFIQDILFIQSSYISSYNFYSPKRPFRFTIYNMHSTWQRITWHLTTNTMLQHCKHFRNKKVDNLTWHRIPQNSNLHNQCLWNIKSRIVTLLTCYILRMCSQFNTNYIKIHEV